MIWLLKPFKIYAYRTRFQTIKRLIISFTTFIDFSLIWLNVQNETMMLHWKVFRGNFIFGKGVMITDHPTTKNEISVPAMRGNNFMGVNIVSSDSNVFATNSGILNQSPPIRASTRSYLDAHVFTPAVMRLDMPTVRASLAEILAAWKEMPKMATMLNIRSTATQIFLKLLANVTIPRPESDFVTTQYIRRFVESSLFNGYFPGMIHLLGTHERVRKDVYYKLRAHGIDLMTIDITMFAAMFSIGTIVMRMVEDTRRFGVIYRELDEVKKRNFVFESLRLYPTVTSVHRRLEAETEVVVSGKTVKLAAGDELVYPFTCSNRDPNVFPEPERMNLERPDDQRDAVLSWSKGPHSCPAKDLSILVTIAMLDTLSERFELEKLRIFDIQF